MSINFGTCALLLSVALNALTSSAQSYKSDLEIKRVMLLDTVETFRGQVFHDGYLWEEKVVIDGFTDFHYELLIFDRTGQKLLKTIRLPHSIMRLYAYSEHEILALGRTQTPWTVHYSIIRNSNGRFSVKTYDISTAYQPWDFAGNSANGGFFGEAGVIYQTSMLGLKPIPVQLSGYPTMKFGKGKLWVIEAGQMKFGDEDLLRIDTKSWEAKRVFPNAKRNGLLELLPLENTPFVAAAEVVENALHLIDPVTLEVKHSLNYIAQPRGLAELGHCLIVSAEDERKIYFIDLGSKNAPVVATWDIQAQVGNTLRMATDLAVDSQNGRLFVRSSYPCTECSETQASVVSVFEPSQETFKTCTSP